MTVRWILHDIEPSKIEKPIKATERLGESFVQMNASLISAAIALEKFNKTYFASG